MILLSLGAQLAGKGCPFFVKGSSGTLGPSHNNFSDLLKLCNPELSPQAGELYSIPMSRAGEEPASGPNQGAGKKGDRM